MTLAKYSSHSVISNCLYFLASCMNLRLLRNFGLYLLHIVTVYFTTGIVLFKSVLVQVAVGGETKQIYLNWICVILD